MKITKEEIIEIISSTQDGNLKVRQEKGKKNPYDSFIVELINDNTDADDNVDVSELISDLNYGISQFQRALTALRENE